MIDATTIPEPEHSIFWVFRIRNDGNGDRWLGWKKE
jgi:hypothetical protein